MTRRDDITGAGSGSHSDEAAHWWVVLNEKTSTPADREAFAQWVRRSPERVEAFIRVSMLSSALKSPAVKWPDTPAEELIRQAQLPVAQVVPLFQRKLPTISRPAGSWRRSTGLLAGAVLGLLLVSVIFVWHATSGVSSYRTALGEQRSVVLEDGSIITINTSSQVEVDYSRARRLIRLVAGEALFEVSHDSQRPFDVVVGEVIVRAVGTKFNVYHRTQQTTVSVVEGTVKVMPHSPTPSDRELPAAESAARIVTAAQKVVLSGEQIGLPEQILDLTPVTAWTQRHLVFENESLVGVVAEFNRYNRRQILIDSPVLNDREITGVFQANDSYPFLVFLSQIPGVRIDDTAEGHYVVTLEAQDRSGEGPKVPQ